MNDGGGARFATAPSSRGSTRRQGPGLAADPAARKYSQVHVRNCMFKMGVLLLETRRRRNCSNDRGRSRTSNQQTILGNIRATQQGTRPQQIPFYEVQPDNKIINTHGCCEHIVKEKNVCC